MDVSSHMLQNKCHWLFYGCLMLLKNVIFPGGVTVLWHPSLKGSEYAAKKTSRVDLQCKEIALHRGNFLWLLQRTIKPCCTWCNYTHFYHLLCLNHYYRMLGKASLSSSQSQPLTALFHSLNDESSQGKLQTQALVSGFQAHPADWRGRTLYSF